MTFDRICVQCGKSFPCSKKTQKCCCDECRKAYRKAYREMWLDANPNYMKAYFMEHRERYTRKARAARKEAGKAV